MMSATRRRPERRKPQGFNLVELLVVATVLGVVVNAAGGALLSEMSSTSKLMRGLADGDGSRAAQQQLLTELAMASSVSSDSTAVPSGCAIGNPLVLIGPSNGWRIAYGVQATPGWRGPRQLVRCGPTYNNAGLQLGSSMQSVVLDGLNATNGFNAALGSPMSGAVNREVAITLRLQPQSGGTKEISFRTTTANNRLFSGMDRQIYDSPSDTSLPRHWQATGGSIAADPARENVIYFANAYASYTLASGCNRTSCSVSGPGLSSPVTISNGDVLVFSDQELRLP